MTYKGQKALSILFGLLSAGGTIFTAILVAKETPKAIEKINQLKNNKNTRKIDYIKELAPIYWPAGVVCLGTVASTTISSVISLKAQASLIATSTMLSQGWRRYKGKVKEVLGIENEQKIASSISKEEYKNSNLQKPYDGKELFYEEHLGFFVCKKEDLLAGLSDLNQRLHTPDPDPNGTFYWTTLYFLVKDAKADVKDKERLEASKSMGWTTDYLCEVYDLSCMWVHPLFQKIIKKETGEVLFTRLSFFEDPIFLEETERSRYHYKSREDFEHEAEIDMHDADALALYTHGYQDTDDSIPVTIQKSFVNSKPDCNSENDDGRRFIPCGMMSQEYLEEDEELVNEWRKTNGL